jgi:glycogen debranching enzyme
MQPDTVVVTAGTRFTISGRSGDIDGKSLHGYYAFDTRFLSSFHVTVQGKPVLATGSGQLDHAVARFYSLNQGARGLPAGTISIAHDRYVAQGMHDDINLINYSTETCTVRLDLTFDVDFADLFEVRRATFHKAGHVSLQRNPGYDFSFVYRRGEFERKTLITLTGDATIHGRVASFEVTLAPKEHWKTCVTVMPVVDGPPPLMSCVEQLVGSPFAADQVGEHALAALHAGQVLPLESVPRLEADNLDLKNAYKAAIEDLRSVRMEYLPGQPILAAGLPWFMAVFGRDSIISAIQTKLLGPELMVGTLRTLASLQATSEDPFRDSAPGKMPHEVRVGELSVLEEVPHSRYYGTVDATPLYIRLLHEAYQWTGDLELLRALLPTAKAAIDWMDNYGDLDGDGFLEYRRRTRHGLRNQGWKDSHDAIAFADGTLAQGAIALAEVQGYAYDAKRRMAALLRITGERQEASRLEAEAKSMREAFNGAFWMPKEGYFALALDGAKRQVDGIASNAGHLLWSGILDRDRAAAVVERLMAPDMFSGWGVRTLSTEMALYNPLSYHNGSIWPHDNSLIASGMAAYGFESEARLIATALVDASVRFQGSHLPELFGGYPRHEHSFPVPYPAANAPQAWACGAVIYFVETLLGAHVRGETLEMRPPSDRLTNLHLQGVPFRGVRLDF